MEMVKQDNRRQLSARVFLKYLYIWNSVFSFNEIDMFICYVNALC